MDNLILGLYLMLIGMLTVYVILLIVIYGSKYLILLINKIAPAEQKAAKSDSSSDAPVEVLNAAVAAITGGKGHIVKITEIK